MKKTKTIRGLLGGRLLLALACVVSAAMTSGCQNKNPLQRQAVSGHVTLDGTPVKLGNVEFVPLDGSSPVSGGAVVRDGRYNIGELRGLPPGKYRVCVHAATGGGHDSAVLGANHNAGPDLPAKGPSINAMLGTEMIAPRFNTESTLTVEVKSGGPNQFHFEVTSK